MLWALAGAGRAQQLRGTDVSSTCRCVPEADPWAGCRSTEGTLQGCLRGPKNQPAQRPWGKRRPGPVRSWPIGQTLGGRGKRGPGSSRGADGSGPPMPGKGLDPYPAGNEGDPQACCLRWRLTKVPAALLSGWVAGYVPVQGSRPRELRGQSRARPSRFDSSPAQMAGDS